ncbi:MAG TPA: ABC transporter ATP-binding protein [Candidatus Binatia bacterium]|nr:ABC transporter ATP-binding protein [Candidatus Binatia bacterium]
MTLQVGEGEVVALMGRNGMGKTTTVHTIVGLVRARSGALEFAGTDIAHKPSHRIARLGIGLVPEGRLVFPTLTVRENLIATSANYGGYAQPWTLERVYALFPRLAQRERSVAMNLSGGEQQMLAIGRALMLSPRLLLLDEATEGLAPLVRADIRAALAQLKAEGQTLVIVDKSLEELTPLADRVVVMEKGRAVWEGVPAELLADAHKRTRLLGL